MSTAGTIGGGFWRQFKVGRPLLYDSPSQLWEDATSYFQYCDENPIETEDWVGKDADKIIRKKPYPYTLAGFCLFVGASRNWWTEFKKSKNLTPEFLAVIRAIDETIENQQIVGAVSGLYQQNIVARLNGLVDHKEVANTGTVNVSTASIDYTKLSNEALREIAAATSPNRPDESES